MKSTWVIMDLVSPSFCLLNNVSLRHPITACFLLLLHGCSVLFSLAEYSTEKRGDPKCAVWLGLCHLQSALENKTRILD